MLSPADFDRHIRLESNRFLECVRSADPAAIVPACPDWHTIDLLWHLTQVQQFWIAIVADRLESPDSVFAERRSEPDPDEDVFQLFADTTDQLLEVLDGTGDDTAVWTWAEDQTVGFIRRRQAHEALIHRLDAESLTNEDMPIDPALATDGIDEVLSLFHGGADHTGFTPDGATCRITTIDTGSSWDLAFGSKPDGDGFVVAGPLEVSTHDLVLMQDATHLDTWLWGRGNFQQLETVGDKALLARLNAIIALGGD